MREKLKRILIITKYRFIGDTLVAVPTMRAVKERWPNSEVSLLSGARACELLQNCPYIDKFFEYDPYRASDKGLQHYLKLLLLLRREKFDISLVLNRSFHSALTACLGGATVRAGWSGFECRDFMLTSTSVYDREKPEIDCFLDVFRSIGGPYDGAADMQFWLTEPELREAKRVVPENAFLIGVQPGATHGYKQWPVSNFVATCEELITRNDRSRIVLIGGPDEVGIAESFMDAAPERLIDRTTNLVGTLTLRCTLAVVSHLNAFVGNDTAIRHASVAADVPSIGLFGPTSRSKWGNENLPRHVVISADTGKMDDISVESVLAASAMWPSQAMQKVAVGVQPTDQCFQQQHGVQEPRKERLVADAQLFLERSMNE